MFNTISSIALLLISGGVAFMYIAPKYGDIMNLRNNSAELSSASMKAKDIDETSKELSEKIGKYPKEGLEKLEQLLPLKFDELRFINDLQGIGERNGLVIKGITILNAPKLDAQNVQIPGVAEGVKSANEGYMEHQFSFTVSASYKTFIMFLKDIERSLELLDIKSVSLENPGVSGVNGQQSSRDVYTYKVELTTYSLK